MELFDIEAECAFIGACFLNYDKVVAQKLPPLESVDFYKSFHQDIYATILKCACSSVVNVVTVSSRMKLDYCEKNYDFGSLLAFQESCPTVESAEHFASVIFDHSQKRRLRNVLEGIRCGVDNGDIQTEEACDTTVQKVFEIYGRSEGGEFRREESAFDLLGDLEVKAEEALAEGRCMSIGEVLPTGFGDFDRWYGFKKGNLIYIGGRPSMGKTTFTLQSAINIATKDSDLEKDIDRRRLVVYFSMEVPKEDLEKKIVCSMENIEYDYFDKKDMKRESIDAIQRSRERLKDRLFFVIDRCCSIAEMRMYIKQIQVKTKRNVDAVFIDRMEFISDKQANKDSENDYITKKSKALVAMAKDFGAAVICLIQLNREAAKRKEKGVVGKPVLTDIRGSGSVEQDAKMVVFIHRECMLSGNEDNKAELIVPKNMCGGTGSVNLLFEKKFPMFVNLDIGHKEPVEVPQPLSGKPLGQMVFEDIPDMFFGGNDNGGNGHGEGGEIESFDFKSLEISYDCKTDDGFACVTEEDDDIT